MTLREMRCREAADRVAVSLLLFLVLYLAKDILSALFPYLFVGLSPVAVEVLTELLQGVLYALSFLLPAMMLARSQRGAGLPVSLQFHRPPRSTPLFLGAGLGLIFAAALLNSLMLEAFHYSEFSGEVLFPSDITADYQLLLMLLTTALIPAVVEEILFRGVIPSSLAPFGRGQAVLWSALLFGVMHQNAGQLLYTVVAGLLLGALYEATHSLGACMLLHFINNGISVLQIAWLSWFAPQTAQLLLFFLQGGLLLMGFVCGGALLWQYRKARKGTPKLPDPDPVSHPVGHFFRPAMVVFFVLSAVQMVLLLLLSLLMYGG